MYTSTSYDGADIRIVKAQSIGALYAAPAIKVWSDATSDRTAQMWAPEIHRLNGPNGYRWYLYYTAGPSYFSGGCCGGQRTYVLESNGDDPLGPYTYKARIYDAANDGYGIDGTILQKGDGSLYFLWAGNNTANLFIASMSNPWTLSSSRVSIATPIYNWEKQYGNTNEGPSAISRNGKVFVTYSGNGCASADYSLGLLTANESSNLLDAASWTKRV